MIAVAPRCDECGFEKADVTPTNAAQTIRALGPQYTAALKHGPSSHDRPSPHTWSPVEYGAHVRDLIAMWSGALHRALTEDHAAIAALDPDIADRWAAEHDYNSADPATIVQEIAANANRMAAKVDKVEPSDWDRVVTISDEPISILAIAQKVAHEGVHHILDIERATKSVSA